MRKKRVFASVLASALVLGNLTLPENISFGKLNFGTLFAQAAEVVGSGTCGDDLTWTLDDEGVLTISGTGNMMENESLSGMPWLNYSHLISSVAIENEVTSISDYAFNSLSLTDIELPDNITSIGGHAFFGCSSLASIKLPANLTTIRQATFIYCTSLISINLPANLTYIDRCAFAGCTALTSIEIPSSVTYIGEDAFVECSNLTDVYYTGSQDEWDNIKIYEGEGNNSLLNATIHYNSYATDYAAGDVNLDGSVDYLDAMTVLRYDAELDTLTGAQKSIVDVNDDSFVDSLDAVLILRYDAGLIDEF